MATPGLGLARLPDDRQANIRASEGAGTTTLSIADSKWQVFNLSAARTAVLPTTGVKDGDSFVLINTSDFDLTINASNGSELTRATSSQAATIRNGKVTILCTTSNPTTPSHWRVIGVFEEHEASGNMAGSITSAVVVRCKRTNGTVVASLRAASGATLGGVEFFTPSSAIPTRFRPSAEHRGIFAVLNNGVYAAGKYEVGTGGTIAFRLVGDAAYSGTTGISLSSGSTQQEITWGLNA